MIKNLLILLCIIFPFAIHAQKLDGIWKGYFTIGVGENKQYYKYEIQILLDKNAKIISGISYSYLNTDFFGKSQLEGLYHPKIKKLDIKESKLINFSKSNSANVCLMRANLSYSKVGDDEIMEGIFSSSNSVTGSDCGQGYLHLEKSISSDFHTETFLAKTKINYKKKKENSEKTIVKNERKKTPKIDSNFSKIDTSVNSKITIAKTKSDHLVEDKNETQTIIAETTDSTTNQSKTINENVINTFNDIPEIFHKRKNRIVKTIVTHTPEIDISFYDNGEIDDDTITVYHNLKPIFERGRLSRQSIDYGFDATEDDDLHSFIIAADNLGKIPPNSALMVIYTNHQRYEVFIESDLKTNGEVRIVYEPIKKSKK